MKQPALLAIATAVVLACSEPPGLAPVPPREHADAGLRIGNKSMGPHADTVLATMRQPLVVMVVDAGGVPVRGAVVHWQGFDGAAVSSETVETDAGGEAAVSLILGARAGAYRAAARLPGVPGSPVLFAATAHPGRPTTLERLTGDGLEVSAGQPVVHTVRAQDAYGNGVGGVRIEWTATEGGSVAWPVSFTNRRGDAEVTRITGSSSALQRTTASAPELPGAPGVGFTIFVRATAPHIVSGQP